MINENTPYRKLRNFAAFFVSKRNLRKLLPSDNMDDILNAIKLYKGRGFYDRIRLAQDNNELTEMSKKVIRQNPKVIVEIGTWNGGTFFVWCRIFPKAKKIISIDLPGGDYGGGYDERRIKFFREFVSDRDSTALHFIRGDSKSQDSISKLAKILGNDKIDFLYIDGDHTYQGVKKDFEIYRAFMSDKGQVGFHDINTLKDGYGVPQFWNEIKNEYKYEEFIAPGSRIMGNGLLYMSSK